MALPTTTFNLSNVRTELQYPSGTKLSEMFTDAPNVSYNLTYKGSKDRLSNFKGYSLITLYGLNYNNARGMAYDGVNMWVCSYTDYAVTKVAPNGTTTNYFTAFRPYWIAYNNVTGDMWMTNYADKYITQMTPAGVTTYYGLTPTGPFGIAFDGVNMWFANYGGNSVTKITPAGVRTNYSLGAGTGPYGIAFDGVNMWTANNLGNSVSKITPAGAVTTYPIGAVVGPNQIAFNTVTGDMWTSNTGNNSVTKITSTGVATTYNGTGGYPNGIAFDGVNMWTSNQSGKSTTKVKPDGTMRTYSLGAYVAPIGIAKDNGGNMWFASVAPGTYAVKLGII